MSSPVKSPQAEWRRPCQVMKRHRHRRRSSLSSAVEQKRNLTSLQTLQDSTDLRLKRGKRRNPFGCSTDDLQAKKPSLSEGVEDNFAVLGVTSHQPEEKQPKENGPLLFEALDNSYKAAERDCQAQAVQLLPEVKKTTEGFPTITFQNEEDGEMDKAVRLDLGWESGASLPQDWCLKQKIRFMSPKSFSWCCSLKSLEEAQGLNDFITRLQEPQTEVMSRARSAGKDFQRCIMYWAHPSLPWLKLFPRISADNNRVSHSSLTTSDDNVLTSLRTDWAEGFTSVFYLVRAGYCPYFYLCAHQFTVLFLRSGGALRGVVTPTTRGFREALVNEGIDFSLPLLDKLPGEGEADREGNGVQTKLGEELDKADDCAASVWLESIGLNKANFPSLDPNKVKIQRECFKAIDNRPQSLVHVEGNNVQALFNFLLNWRSCVASSGPQAGIPPTILSPVGFRGATLKALKVKSSSVKQLDDHGAVRHYGVLELSGPILLHTMEALTELFISTQDGEYTATCHNHDSTQPFNAALQTTKKTDENHRSQCDTSIPSDPPQAVCGGALRELEYSQSQFFWKT